MTINISQLLSSVLTLLSPYVPDANAGTQTKPAVSTAKPHSTRVLYEALKKSRNLSEQTAQETGTLNALAAYLTASADWMEQNPERALAFAQDLTKSLISALYPALIESSTFTDTNSPQDIIAALTTLANKCTTILEQKDLSNQKLLEFKRNLLKRLLTLYFFPKEQQSSRFNRDKKGSRNKLNKATDIAITIHTLKLGFPGLLNNLLLEIYNGIQISRSSGKQPQSQDLERALLCISETIIHTLKKQPSLFNLSSEYETKAFKLFCNETFIVPNAYRWLEFIKEKRSTSEVHQLYAYYAGCVLTGPKTYNNQKPDHTTYWATFGHSTALCLTELLKNPSRPYYLTCKDHTKQTLILFPDALAYNWNIIASELNQEKVDPVDPRLINLNYVLYAIDRGFPLLKTSNQFSDSQEIVFKKLQKMQDVQLLKFKKAKIATETTPDTIDSQGNILETCYQTIEALTNPHKTGTLASHLNSIRKKPPQKTIRLFFHMLKGLWLLAQLHRDNLAELSKILYSAWNHLAQIIGIYEKSNAKIPRPILQFLESFSGLFSVTHQSSPKTAAETENDLTTPQSLQKKIEIYNSKLDKILSIPTQTKLKIELYQLIIDHLFRKEQQLGHHKKKLDFLTNIALIITRTELTQIKPFLYLLRTLRQGILLSRKPIAGGLANSQASSQDLEETIKTLQKTLIEKLFLENSLSANYTIHDYLEVLQTICDEIDCPPIAYEMIKHIETNSKLEISPLDLRELKLRVAYFLINRPLVANKQPTDPGFYYGSIMQQIKELLQPLVDASGSTFCFIKPGKTINAHQLAQEWNQILLELGRGKIKDTAEPYVIKLTKPSNEISFWESRSRKKWRNIISQLCYNKDEITKSKAIKDWVSSTVNPQDLNTHDQAMPDFKAGRTGGNMQIFFNNRLYNCPVRENSATDNSQAIKDHITAMLFNDKKWEHLDNVQKAIARFIFDKGSQRMLSFILCEIQNTIKVSGEQVSSTGFSRLKWTNQENQLTCHIQHESRVISLPGSNKLLFRKDNKTCILDAADAENIVDFKGQALMNTDCEVVIKFKSGVEGQAESKLEVEITHYEVTIFTPEIRFSPEETVIAQEDKDMESGRILGMRN